MSGEKFYIGVDCEGVACAVGSPGQGLSGSTNFAFAMQQATREANAAARALFDSGASEVIVWDNHHYGLNLSYNDLDERCKITLGAGHKVRFPGLDETFSGVLFIGYHARENSQNGVLAHTYSSTAFQYLKINGQEMGEMQIDAGFAALSNVPVMFAASDKVAVEQAKESFPWVETVVTKEGLSWNSAISLHPKESCRQIYEGVCKAYRRLTEMQCFRIAEPVDVEIRYKRIDTANGNLVDQDGVRFKQIDPFTRHGIVPTIKELPIY